VVGQQSYHQTTTAHSPEVLMLSRSLLLELNDLELLSILQANRMSATAETSRQDLLQLLEHCVNVTIVD
jgi:hypothetical protein